MRRASISVFIFMTMAVALLAMPRAASAAPILIINPDHILLGADNVEVNGQTYNVRFLDSSCQVVFNGCDDPSDFDFTDPTDAIAAGLVLASQVLVDIPNAEPFDTLPFLTAGCGNQFTDPPFCGIFIPVAFENFDPSTGNVVSLLTINPAGPDNQILTFTARGAADDLGLDDHAVYAQFTPVPEPTSMFLLGSGVLGLGAKLRRRRA